MIPVRDDELTEYPETEYEDPSFNSVNNGGGGGLFSGKGAAKAQAMFLARKARAKQFTKVSYGENDEHPDLEHLEESSEEESSDDEVIVPAHTNIIKAYEQVDHQRRQRQEQHGVTQQLNITGKGAEIFAKRQERMNNYVADGDNQLCEQLDLDDFQMKKCDEGDDSPTMPKFNVQLNHIDRPKQESAGGTSQINPFSVVNLRATGRTTREEVPKEEEYEEEIINGHNQPGQHSREQSMELENGRESVLSNESTLSTASTTNSVARGWNPSSFYSNTSSALSFKRVSAPRGKGGSVTSIQTTSSVRKPTNPFLAGNVRKGSLPKLTTPDPLSPLPQAPPSAPPVVNKPQSFFASTPTQPVSKPAAPWAPKTSTKAPVSAPKPTPKPALSNRAPSPVHHHPQQSYGSIKAPKSNYQIQMPRAPRQEFKCKGI